MYLEHAWSLLSYFFCKKTYTSYSRCQDCDNGWLVGWVGRRCMSQTNQIKVTMNNQSNCRLQQLQRQQVCADTCWRQLNNALAICRRNHYQLALFHAGLWWGELKVWTYIYFLEKRCFRMRIYFVEIPTEITETSENVSFDVRPATASSFWRSGASNSPYMAILTNQRFLRILAESFSVVLHWTLIQVTLEISENVTLRRNEQALSFFSKLTFGWRVSEYFSVDRNQSIWTYKLCFTTLYK